MYLGTRLDDDHGLVIDREIPFLRLLIRGANPAADGESLLRRADDPRGEQTQYEQNRANSSHSASSVQPRKPGASDVPDTLIFVGNYSQSSKQGPEPGRILRQLRMKVSKNLVR